MLFRSGTVRHRAAFELAEGEEALQEHLHPLPDCRQIVLFAAFGREVRWPRAPAGVFPRVQRHEGDFRRAESVAQRIEQGEILQRVGAYLGLRALRRLARAGWDQLRGDFRRNDRLQRLAHIGREFPCADDPADQMLD